MSILIKGMEMPKSCGFCPFENHTDNGYECRINGCLTEYQKRPPDCPLALVPPHGRLIDADALIDYVAEKYNVKKVGEQKAFEMADFVLFDIPDAPTIIPAEEGE